MDTFKMFVFIKTRFLHVRPCYYVNTCVMMSELREQSINVIYTRCCFVNELLEAHMRSTIRSAAAAAAAVCCYAAVVRHRVQDGKIFCWLIESDSNASFIQTRFIFVCLPWQYCRIYGLNDGHAQSQGGRQPAATSPPLVLVVLLCVPC